MAHQVIRTVKGRRYRYLEETVRTERGPRKRSLYMGPVEAITGIPRLDWKATFTNEPGAREAERGEEQAQKKEREAAQKTEAEKNAAQEKAPPSDGEAKDGGDDPTPSSET